MDWLGVCVLEVGLLVGVLVVVIMLGGGWERGLKGD